MQDMSRGRLKGRAPVLSVQMQWQHQICASELSHGMVITFTKETLRTMQDTFPLYEALPSSYAEHGSAPGLSPPGCRTHMDERRNLVPLPTRFTGLDSLAAVVHADNMERTVLVGGR